MLSFLAERGLHIPRDVSVLCMNHEPWFAWQRRPIAHLYGDESQMVRYIVRWVNAVTRGRADLRGVHFPAEYVAGESLGPVPKQGS